MGKYTLKLDKDRLAESRKRVSDYYNGRPVDRIPFSFRIQTSGLPHYNYRQCNEDFSKFIEQTIAGVNAQFEGFPDTDYLPMFYLDFLGEGLIASMFGAEQLVVDENPPFTRGRVLNDIDDLDKLPAKVDPENDGWGKRLMQVCDMCMDAAGGEIPICVCDHQSPYGIATKIMDNENLMLAMYDAPEEMMRFMEIVTGAIDGTIAAMERRVGKENLVKNASAPVPGGETGLILWDDYVSVLSPEMREKFCRPFNMKLYDKYGYGHLHTCGPYFPGYLEACLACKPKSLDLSIMRGMSRSREDFLRFRERTREAGVILCGTPVVSEGSIFENKFIEPDEEFLTEMARGGILPGGGGSYEDGVRMTEMWKRISKRVL